MAIALALLTGGSRDSSAQSPAPECREPQMCRELALEARERGAYETFHDLAWRAVQTGRPNDPDLMYLLARAQALSGRRRDALVTLRRLAEAGVANDAATDEDFRRVRELGEWQYIVTLASKAPPAKPSVSVSEKPPATAVEKPPAPVPSAAAKPPAPASGKPAAAAAVPPATAPASSALRVEPAAVQEAARFSTGPFTPGGLAYDGVSRRFLFGDLTGRRLFVVGEGSDRTVDLVRGDAAGFGEVTAIAIDAKRGDLWVASAAGGGNPGALHRLQLISGRVLVKFAAPAEARLTDVAVTDDGTVLALDGAAPRVLVLRPGATAVEPLMPLKTSAPVSITVADDGRVAYVAHREGITRLDLESRLEAPLNASTGISLAGFDHLRLHRDVLVGSQRQPDGSRGLVRLQLNRDRRRVTGATLIDTLPADAGSAPFAAISNGDLYYLVAGDTSSGSVNVQVRRVKLP
jgi:hypothetical protein